MESRLNAFDITFNGQLSAQATKPRYAVSLTDPIDRVPTRTPRSGSLSAARHQWKRNRSGAT